MRHATLLKMTTALTLLAAPGTAFAQAVPAAGQQIDDAGVGEIIVQAQRTEQSLQKVPVAVTPVSGADLETRRLRDLAQLTLAVPSLEVGNDNTFTIRGIGSQIFASNVDSSVGIMVDDVSLGVPIFMSNAAFVDIGQVEALTGPQGLLFGRNSSAGLLNIVTKKPQLGETSGDFNLEYQNRDAPGGHFGIAGTAILNVPTGANSALRFNVLYSNQDPVAKAIVNKSSNYQDNQTRLMGKVKWLWEPSDGTSVYLIGDYSRERGIGGIWDDTWRATGINAAGVPNSGGLDTALAAVDGITPGPKNLLKGTSGPGYRSVNTGGLSLNASTELTDSLTLSNIFAWRAYGLDYNLDADLSSANSLDVNTGTEKYNQYSEELRLAYKGDVVDGQIGLYGFWSTNDAFHAFKGPAILWNIPNPPNIADASETYVQKTRSLAAYGQFNIHATDQLTLIAGGRVTGDRVSVDSTVLSPGPIPLFGPPGRIVASRTNTNFSYKVGAQYDIAATAMVYATWGTGYKGPALKTHLAYVGEDPYLRPEAVKGVEAGFKTKLFDNKLRLNVAGFIQKFTDFQVQAFNGTSVTLTNANGVKSSGVEINSTLRVTPAFTFNYNATLQDSHFTDFPGNPCWTNQPASTCPGGVAFNGKGLKTATSANYHGTLQGVYAIPIGDAKLELEGNWYHRSTINFSQNGNPYTELGAIDVFGASISYRTEKGINFAIFCKNCTNKVYPTFIGVDPPDAAVFGLTSTQNRWGYNSVRTIGASVGFKF